MRDAVEFTMKLAKKCAGLAVKASVNNTSGFVLKKTQLA
jgi:hypothetical protein